MGCAVKPRIGTKAGVGAVPRATDRSERSSKCGWMPKEFASRARKGEVKYFDTSFDETLSSANDWGLSTLLEPATYINSSGAVAAYTGGASLIPSAVGSGYGEVVGNSYVIKRIKVRGVLYPGTNNTADAVRGGNAVRMILVQDMQPNGAQAAPSTFLTDFGVGSQNISCFMSIASGTGGRFRFLWDKIIELPASTSAVSAPPNINTGGQLKVVEFEKTWKRGLRVFIKGGGTSPGVANLSNCNLFLVAQNSNTGVQTVSWRGCTRCSYYDQ